MKVHGELAIALGAEHDVDGYLLTDRHQQTAVPGLFAVGDVVKGLNQISVAVGQAAKAASAIHLRLPGRL
jgi:thioredoxin reductase (NADPH)